MVERNSNAKTFYITSGRIEGCAIALYASILHYILNYKP